MQKARQSERQSSAGASRLRFRFVDLNGQARLRENDRSRKAVGAGADHDRALHSLSSRVLVMRRQFVGPLYDLRPAIRCQCDFRRIQSEQLAPPPVSRSALFLHRGEPVLPEYRARESGWRVRKRIGLEQAEHIGIIRQQSFFGQWNDLVLAPFPQRCEPEIPLESRLIRRVNPRCFCSEPAACIGTDTQSSSLHHSTLGIRSRNGLASLRQRGHIDWQYETGPAAQWAPWEVEFHAAEARSFPLSCRRQSMSASPQKRRTEMREGGAPAERVTE